MSRIILKQLSIVNFKGVRNLTIDFEDSTSIFGANGTGKTSVFDAFTWLLFGKNSEDKKDFEVKRLDKNGNPIQKTEVEVSAIIWADDEEITIKRILKEKWVKQRGALDAVYTGNETLYYWNEVPLSQKEFQSKVSSVLDEQIFKLITSPTAFNSLKWQDRRNVLIQIVGDISDRDLAIGNEEYEKLLFQISNKSLEEYKKQIASTIKKAKDDIKTIPTRVDEVERSKPELVDVQKIEAEILFKQKEIESIEKQLLDKSAAYNEVIKKKTEHQNKVFELKSELNSIEFEIKEKAKLETKKDTSKVDSIKNEIDKKDEELKTLQTALKSLTDKRTSLKAQLESIDSNLMTLREDWKKINAEEFKANESDCKCPTCKREFDNAEEKIAEIKNNFIKQKNERLEVNQTKGKSLVSEKKNTEEEIKNLDSRIEKGESLIKDLQSKISSLRADLMIENNSKGNTISFESVVSELVSKSEKYQTLKSEIQKLEAVTFDLPNESNSELSESKKTIQKEIDALKVSLRTTDQIIKADIRIKELLDEEKKLAQEIAKFEKIQYTIDNFVKLKIDTLESRINKKFQFVKFKLFQTQINGAEVECCDALIDGVPFSDANTASKINAGIDIINSLCNYYQVSAPIFIDNRESVVDLIDSDSQIINLIVSAEDTKLRIENKQENLATI